MSHERPAHTRYIDAINPVHGGEVGHCGPSSLRIAFNALGKHVTEQEIADAIQDVEDGMSWVEMIAVAQQHGCVVGVYKSAEYEALVNAYNRSACPIIVGWDSDRDGTPGAHFSVVKHVNGEMITLADPQFEDLYSLSKLDFMEKWFDDDSRHAFMVLMPNSLDNHIS